MRPEGKPALGGELQSTFHDGAPWSGARYARSGSTRISGFFRHRKVQVLRNGLTEIAVELAVMDTDQLDEGLSFVSNHDCAVLASDSKVSRLSFGNQAARHARRASIRGVFVWRSQRFQLMHQRPKAARVILNRDRPSPGAPGSMSRRHAAAATAEAAVAVAASTAEAVSRNRLSLFEEGYRPVESNRRGAPRTAACPARIPRLQQHPRPASYRSSPCASA